MPMPPTGLGVDPEPLVTEFAYPCGWFVDVVLCEHAPAYAVGVCAEQVQDGPGSGFHRNGQGIRVPTNAPANMTNPGNSRIG